MREYHNTKCWPENARAITEQSYRTECIRCTKEIELTARNTGDFEDKLQGADWFDFGEGWECAECITRYHYDCCGGFIQEEHGGNCPVCS